MNRTDVTRRSIVGGALASAAAIAATRSAAAEAGCRIGPPPHPKGPLVFMDYDQIELDAAYDQSSYAPLNRQITARFTSDSEAARARLGQPERHSYGPSQYERLDLF